jgi:hypothetical protein
VIGIDVAPVSEYIVAAVPRRDDVSQNESQPCRSRLALSFSGFGFGGFAQSAVQLSNRHCQTPFGVISGLLHGRD